MSFYAMAPQQSYMPQAALQPPRQYSTHGTSSAFSSSALPDEDWTKISDPDERRRIQNRIAQRNYRKRLKHRLEDLERRVRSLGDGESDKPQPTPTPKNTTAERDSTSKSPSKQAATAIPTKPARTQYTPSMDASDDLIFGTPSFDERERNSSPPMFSSYTTYPAPDELLLQPYGATQPYPTITTTEQYANYLTSTTMFFALPSISYFGDDLKPESFSSVNDGGVGGYLGYRLMHSLAKKWARFSSNQDQAPIECEHSEKHPAGCGCGAKVLNQARQRKVLDTVAIFAEGRKESWSKKILGDMFVDSAGDIVIYTETKNLESDSYRQGLSRTYRDLDPVRVPSIYAELLPEQKSLDPVRVPAIYVELLPEQKRNTHRCNFEDILDLKHECWTGGEKLKNIRSVERTTYGLVTVVPTKKFRKSTCSILSIGIDREKFREDVDSGLRLKLLWRGSSKSATREVPSKRPVARQKLHYTLSAVKGNISKESCGEEWNCEMVLASRAAHHQVLHYKSIQLRNWILSLGSLIILWHVLEIEIARVRAGPTAFPRLV